MSFLCDVSVMSKENSAKLSAVVAFSILLHIIYHIALIADYSGLICKLIYKISKVGWIGSDFILCVAGYYCMQVYLVPKGNVGKWLATTAKHLAWIVPSYYLMLFLYLTVGLEIQHSLGYPFEFNQSYLMPLLLFYSNFNFAHGPWTGVALEGAFLLSMVTQLFVVWGAVLSVIGRNRMIPLIIGVIWGLAFSLRLLHAQDWHWFSYFNTFTRLDGFLAGLLLAYLKDDLLVGRLLEIKKNSILVVSLILFVIGGLLTGGMDVSNPYTNYVAFPVLALFSFGALNWFLEYPGKISNRFIRYNKLVFAVYLMKLPIIYMGLALTKRIAVGNSELLSNLLFIVVSFFMCLLFGWIWNFLLEATGRVILKKCCSCNS